VLWIFILLYVLAQALIAIFVARKIRNQDDYFLAGRRIGPFLATFSIFATWFGAETCISSASRVYESGLSGGRAEPMGYTLCLFIAGLFFAKALWKSNIVTLGDLFKKRYSPTVEKIAVLIMIPSSILWAGAQVRAFGQLVSSFSDISPTVAILLSGCFVILYTSIGGLLGDIITDTVQGFILMIGLFVLLYLAVDGVGGWESVFSRLSATDRLSLIGPNESFLERLDIWMVPILGSLVTQELVSRMLACKNANVARTSTFMAAGMYLLIGLIPVTLGLIGPQLLPSLPQNDQFLPELAATLLHPALLALFAGAILSAILSTVDSTLLTVSAFVTQNLLTNSDPTKSDSAKLRTARICVVASGIAAIGFAVSAEGIYELVYAASSFGTAGIFIIFTMGISGKHGGAFAAGLTAVAGVVLLPIYEYLLDFRAPFVMTILSCLGIYLFVAVLEKRFVLVSRSILIDSPVETLNYE